MVNYRNGLKEGVEVRREMGLPAKGNRKTLVMKIFCILLTLKAMVFPVIMYGCESWTIKKSVSAKELMLLGCGAGEDS